MKNLILIFSILLAGFSAKATSSESENNLGRGYNGNAYIFVEGDVEFSVFPDGQFDFVYIGPQKNSQITITSPNVNVSFNSGYNYDAYVQYDDYGAVIQIENIPIYYDQFGRIVRAGSVDIRYNNRRIVRVGGLHVIYNNHGYFSHCTGIVNVYNPYYVYRPWHVYYARPMYTHVIVYDYPYRAHYHPVRYSYHDHVNYYNNRNTVAYHNSRREFYRPGSRVHQEDGRVVRNNNYDPNRTNTMVANSGRNNSPVRDSRTSESNTVRSNTQSDTRNTMTNTTRTSRSNPVKYEKTSVRNENSANPIRNNQTVRSNDYQIRSEATTNTRNYSAPSNSQGSGVIRNVAQKP